MVLYMCHIAPRQLSCSISGSTITCLEGNITQATDNWIPTLASIREFLRSMRRDLLTQHHSEGNDYERLAA